MKKFMAVLVISIVLFMTTMYVFAEELCPISNNETASFISMQNDWPEPDID